MAQNLRQCYDASFRNIHLNDLSAINADLDDFGQDLNTSVISVHDNLEHLISSHRQQGDRFDRYEDDEDDELYNPSVSGLLSMKDSPINTARERTPEPLQSARLNHRQNLMPLSSKKVVRRDDRSKSPGFYLPLNLSQKSNLSNILADTCHTYMNDHSNCTSEEVLRSRVLNNENTNFVNLPNSNVEQSLSHQLGKSNNFLQAKEDFQD